jgi:L-ascorbate metabolism protein UlaG (beta-lactamase superfamily)
MWRIGRWLLGALALLVVAATIDGWRAFGKGASGVRRARMEKSPEYQSGHFENPQPLINYTWRMLEGSMNVSPDVSPHVPLPVEAVEPARFAAAPPSGLRVTWFGHSSMYVEIDGARVLTDPVWTERISPIDGVGPTRWYAPLVALESLPKPDAVVISHDHYDHLDYPTIRAMKDWPVKFLVPLGVGAHLEYWGVPAEKIVEMDWWEHTRIGSLEITCAPARHASGRAPWDQNATLWAGWAIAGDRHRVYYSGDTGLFPGMRDIGERLGPFDLTMIETGQYDRAWPDWHIGPEQAVTAHQLVRGRAMLPVHWGLLALAYHGWTEPIERVARAAQKASVRLFTPPPGRSIEPDVVATKDASTKWWPTLGFKTAEEAPIVSSQLGDLVVP